MKTFCARRTRLVLVGVVVIFLTGAAAPPLWGALAQQTYVKASNTGEFDDFGRAVAVSGDILVVGAPDESSNATGVNGAQNNDLERESGAAYIYVRSGTNWTQQAYLKASDSVRDYQFGTAVAVSGDTVVVGAPGATNLAAGNNSFGTVYIFTRSGTNWTQQARLRASNAGGRFGAAVSLWDDTLVVGAPDEDSNGTGVNGSQTTYTSMNSGAAYVFVRNAGVWTQQAYLKASNNGSLDLFGRAVAVMGDTVVVGADNEDSNATGVNGNQANNSAFASGAAYVFVRNAGAWFQQAYLKASNTGASDYFGTSVAVSGDTIVISAREEDSDATGVNGDGANNNRQDSGAAYVFTRDAGVWSQQAYLKASNPDNRDRFGFAVAVENDTVVVTAYDEDSASPGVNGNQADNTAFNSGAAYVFARTGTNWSQTDYLKAANPGAGADEFELGDNFGRAVSLSGNTIALGAPGEDSSATGVNGNQADESAEQAGAAYVFDAGTIPNSLYISVPGPFETVDFGIVDATTVRTVVIGNRGPGTLRILSVSIDAHPSSFWLSFRRTICEQDRDPSSAGVGVCSAPLPYSIPGDNSVPPLRVVMGWNAFDDEAGNLDATLRIVTDDPVSPMVTYRLVGRSFDQFVQTVEGVLINIINLLPTNAVAATPRKSGGGTGFSLPTTASFAMNPNAPHSLTAEIPPHLGGGSVVLSNFTGSFTVSALSVPNDTNRAFLRVESGTFTAPSFTLPSGLQSGLNTLTFGPPEQSSGLLNLSNGQYEVTATATITNQLIPQGVTVRGNYAGVYNFQTETANLVSDSADLFTPSGLMALTRATNGLWLTWANTNAVQHATSVTGPWHVLTNAVSPHLVAPTNAQQFFRLTPSPAP